MHTTIKEQVDKDNEKKKKEGDSGRVDTQQSLLSSDRNKAQSTSKDKNKLPHNFENSNKETKKIPNDPNINYISNSTTNTNPKKNEAAIICLCGKSNEDSLFDKNKCKLCGKMRKEKSLKKIQTKVEIEKGTDVQEKILNTDPVKEKIQITNAINNKQLITTGSVVKKIEAKQQNIDYTK